MPGKQRQEGRTRPRGPWRGCRGPSGLGAPDGPSRQVGCSSFLTNRVGSACRRPRRAPRPAPEGDPGNWCCRWQSEAGSQMLRARWRHQGHVCRGAKLLALTWGPTLEPPGPCGEVLPSKPSTSGVGGHRGEGQSPEPVPSVPSSHPDCPSGSFRKLCWTILSFGAQWAHAQTCLGQASGRPRARGAAAGARRGRQHPRPGGSDCPPPSPPSPRPGHRLLPSVTPTTTHTPPVGCSEPLSAPHSQPAPPTNASAPRLPPARQPVIGSLSPWGRDGRVSITSGPQRAAWRRPTRSGSGSGQHHHTQRTGEAPGRPGTP